MSSAANNNEASAGWRRASRSDPCPICGKPDNCCVSVDGRFVWCGREAEGALRENHGGQFLHVLEERTGFRDWRSPRVAATKPHDGGPHDGGPHGGGPDPFAQEWQSHAELLTAGAERYIEELARIIGVSPESLHALSVGYDAKHECWTFPERDGYGRVVGISRRFRDGRKQRMRGATAGLTYAPDWSHGDEKILLVEGASDVAACITMGIPAVGRPSCRGGIRFLTQLLTHIPDARPIVVLGERDKKTNGLWPGRDGAIKTATQLAESLNRTIGWALPPDDAKDVRDWYRHHVLSH